MIPAGTAVPEPEVFDGTGGAPLPVFFQGRMLLFFFAADCERCAQVLAMLARWRTAGAEVMGISQETIEDTAEFLEQTKFSLPLVIDDRPYPAARAFEVERLPALALVDNDQIEWTSDGCSQADLAEIHRMLGLSTPLSDVELGPGRLSKHLE